MERVDVAIVGGGPAGTSAAEQAAARGSDTVVLEQGVPRADREGLGPDSTDAAGMLDYWVDIMDFDYREIPEEVVLQELDAVEFVGPTESVELRSTGMESSYPRMGYTFDRVKMDDWLRQRAEDAGADYRVGTSVSSVESEVTAAGDHTHTLTLKDGETVEAEYVILADGPQRRVTIDALDQFLPAGRSASEVLSPPVANHIAYQEYREFPEELFQPTKLRFWWGWMPGETAYPWVFPNDGTVARVGLTMPMGMGLSEVPHPETYALLRPTDAEIPAGGEYIRRLLERVYGDEYDIEADFPLVEDRGKTGGTETYPISSTRPIDSPARAGIAVVGGAMGTTSAFHEGGYHVAVRSGTIAGRLAATDSLASYNRVWKRAIGGEILRNVAFADLVGEYEPDDWDRTFRSVRRMIDPTSVEVGPVRGLLSAGLDGAKLVMAYKWIKRRYRKGGYVQIREDDYVV